MEKFISKFFRRTDFTDESQKKEAYGKFSGAVGIIANLLLFAGKFTVGTLFSSVAVIGDGFNNLSDAGSSLISLISFKLSGKPADKEHPYGHARIEYITSMAVSFIILMVGIELLKSSIDKIRNPEESGFSIVMIAVLTASIIVKLGLFIMNRYLGKKSKSIMLLASSTDSLSDTLATGVVVISLIVSRFTGVELDGWMGLVVAGFILFAGYGILRDTMNDIIGAAPEAEFTAEIRKFIASYDGVLGIHDLIIHSYGTGNCFASAHVEVSGDENVFITHDLMDNIEKDIHEKLNVHLVIHMDPIENNNAVVSATRETVLLEVKKIGEELGTELDIHDFRMVVGQTHTNLIFDVVVPFDCKTSLQDVRNMVASAVRKLNDQYCPVINIDRI